MKKIKELTASLNRKIEKKIGLKDVITVEEMLKSTIEINDD